MGRRLSIYLTDEHAALLEWALVGGGYASASELIREALRAWRAAQPAPPLGPPASADEAARVGVPVEPRARPAGLTVAAVRAERARRR